MAINPSEITPTSRKKRALKIHVTSNDKTSVNVNVPLNLAKMALKFVPKDAVLTLKEQNIELADIAALIDSDELGEVSVDVADGDSTVRIFVE